MAAMPEGNSHTSAGCHVHQPGDAFADRGFFFSAVAGGGPPGQDAFRDPRRHNLPRVLPIGFQVIPSRDVRADAKRRLVIERMNASDNSLLGTDKLRSAPPPGATGRQNNIRRARRTVPRTRAGGRARRDAERTADNRFACGRRLAPRLAHSPDCPPRSAGRPRPRDGYPESVCPNPRDGNEPREPAKS